MNIEVAISEHLNNKESVSHLHNRFKNSSFNVFF